MLTFLSLLLPASCEEGFFFAIVEQEIQPRMIYEEVIIQPRGWPAFEGRANTFEGSTIAIGSYNQEPLIVDELTVIIPDLGELHVTNLGCGS